MTAPTMATVLLDADQAATIAAAAGVMLFLGELDGLLITAAQVSQDRGLTLTQAVGRFDYHCLAEGLPDADDKR